MDRPVADVADALRARDACGEEEEAMRVASEHIGNGTMHVQRQMLSHVHREDDIEFGQCSFASGCLAAGVDDIRHELH
jgi:hypothetical protein